MAYEVNWFTMGGGGAALAIDSVTSDADLDVVVASIPAGAVVVVLGSWDTDSSTAPTCASANLTFGAAKVHSAAAGNASCTIFAAVAGSALTSETITVTQSGAPNRVTVVVLTGASSASFPTASGTNAFTVNLTGTITGTTAGSYVLGSWSYAASGATVTPSAGTTELYDNQPAWHNRSTDPSSGGDVTLAGTGSAAGTSAWALIEILEA